MLDDIDIRTVFAKYPGLSAIVERLILIHQTYDCQVRATSPFFVRSDGSLYKQTISNMQICSATNQYARHDLADELLIIAHRFRTDWYTDAARVQIDAWCKNIAEALASYVPEEPQGSAHPRTRAYLN